MQTSLFSLCLCLSVSVSLSLSPAPATPPQQRALYPHQQKCSNICSLETQRPRFVLGAGHAGTLGQACTKIPESPKEGGCSV